MRPAKPARRCCRLALAIALVAASVAHAAGPRWITGPPYFTATPGTPVVWYTLTPQYFTDPGDLSSYVPHASADALVAAAAAVWNVPTSMLTLAQGGTLAEHVSSANSYITATGAVFPADVSAANYAAIQIAVLYDSNGSITDMLLGSGASAPAECAQNAVTEDVDSITPAGFIQHAILVLNGRCTGAAAAQQLQMQMQYQLERAFGRILGVGWSQTNDNVFTGTPQPTNNQALHWPIMHPIDIVCGPYTYQCLPQPFTLRDDDVSAISALYPSGLIDDPNPTPPAAGKIWTWTQASQLSGTVSFPTGEGMAGVNVLVQRQQGGWSIPEAWYDVSSVSGYRFQQNAGNPVTGAAAGLAQSMGSADPSLQGYYDFAWLPDIDPAGAQNGGMFVYVSTEPINPLYTGAHAVGPYVPGQVATSGTTQPIYIDQYAFYPMDYSWQANAQAIAPTGAASDCGTSGDGTEAAPLAVASTGWWTGTLCPHGHAAWSSFSAQSGGTATLEVTALDESGLATTAKAMPLIGVWAATDPTGTLPTVAATPSAFNTISLGTTATTLSTSAGASFRFVLADGRGDGRPDFAYQARVLYASSVTPSAVSLAGGQITVTGIGFRPGNEVLVNGVPAQATSWTANSIVAVAPPQSAFSSAPSAAVPIEVLDLSTGGTTTLNSALTYSSSIAPDQMQLVAAPPATVLVGATAAFTVRVTQSDGVTPVAGLPVTFTASASGLQIAGCAASPCTALTSSSGLATLTVTPTAFGEVTLTASAVGTSHTVSFAAIALTATALQPTELVAAGATVTWTPQLSAIQNGAPVANLAVAWISAGPLTLSSSSTLTNAQGIASDAARAGPLAAGAQATALGCGWPGICAAFTVTGVDPSLWRLAVVSGAGQAIASGATYAPVVFRVTDPSGDPIAGAPVALYQTMNPPAPACPTRGRCAAAPVIAASTAAATSDVNGLVTLTPLQLPSGGSTNLAAAAGTQAFAALTLTQQP